jgi:RND family efflux transporter MFP subunit
MDAETGNEKAVPVAVAKVQKMASREKIELPGTILPWAVTTLAAEIDGRIEKYLHNEGEFIKKGEPIVQLDTRPLELELALAEAERGRVANRLKELETGTRHEVVEAARAALKQAAVRLELAEAELMRVHKLHNDGVLSVNDFDNARAQAEQARELLNEKQAQLNEQIAGPRIEQIEQEESSLAAASARIEIIRDQIQRGTIRAPFAGFLVKKQTEVGQWVEKGDPLFNLIASHPVKAEVHLPQAQFNLVRTGMSARVTLESPSDDKPSRVYEGKVIEKIHSGDPASRTFPVRVKIENPKFEIAVGMLARVEFTSRSKTASHLYVPKDALVRSPFSTVVWRVIENEDGSHSASKVTVDPGGTIDSLIAIAPVEGEVRENDWVVVHGNERLRPGARVVIEQPSSK